MTVQVTPPGFDMANALDGDDLIWPWIVREEGKDTWGKMIVADRRASMSDYRDGLNQSARYGTIADNVALDIKYAVEHGFDSWPDYTY